MLQSNGQSFYTNPGCSANRTITSYVLLSEINTISAFPIFPALAFSIKPDGLMR